MPNYLERFVGATLMLFWLVGTAHAEMASARVRVCHSGCVTVRINDRGPFVRGRDIDLSPAAARAIGLDSIGHVTISEL